VAQYGRASRRGGQRNERHRGALKAVAQKRLPIGTNPLEWTVLDPEAHADRETSYRRQLPDAVTWLSGARRLDEQLIAERDARSEASGGLRE
jgi:hypothetical protein